MNSHCVSPTAANPFCVRRVRPGAIPFRFPEGITAAELVARLERNHWWGQLVGPHGSGKSSLLAALIPVVETTGRLVVRFDLHDGQRRLSPGWRSAEIGADTLVIVDGFEQLGRLSRFRLKRLCRRRQSGLLVTAHEDVGLGEVYRTDVSPELLEKLVAHLVEGYPPLVGKDDIHRCCNGQLDDVREVLFSLYDLYEQRRRTSTQS